MPPPIAPAPITATFLIGVLWRRATARAAFSTLIFGGLVGATRFLLDILHNALGYDLGSLNAVVEFSFLNFSVIVFFVCVGLMIAASLAGERPAEEKVAGLTLEWGKAGANPGSRRFPAMVTAGIGLAVVLLWFHFR